MDFIEKYRKVSEEKNSILCVGLDPRIEKLKKLGYEINTPLEDAPGVYIEFCLDIIEKTHQDACFYKPNRQFIIPLSGKQVRRIVDRIHDHGSLAIMDHKLGDIGRSNQEALFWISQEGFDALTYSPFAGNIEEAVQMAHEFGLGVFVLCLMSNPEATLFMKGRFLREEGGRRFEVYGFEEIAKRAAKAKADGVVVGATGHVTREDLKAISRYVGPDIVKLYPGVGTQGGDERKVIRYGGLNPMINVGSALVFEEKPGVEAAKWSHRFREAQEEIVPSFAKSMSSEMANTVAALYWEIDGGVDINIRQPFELASGNVSPIYLDGRKVFSSPLARPIILGFANTWVDEILSQYPRNSVVVAGGETMGAIVAQALANQFGLRYAFIRKQAKGHGLRRQVEGDLQPGDNVLFFEDLITEGTSAASFVAGAIDAGARIYKIIYIVEREQGGRQRLAGLPAPVDIERMTTLERILEKGVEKKRISLSEKQEIEEYFEDPRTWCLDRGFGWKE